MTVKLRFWVLLTPLEDPLIVNGNVPVGVPVVVPMIRVTDTGSAEVGKTVLDGKKLQAAPAGKPLHDKSTAALNEPAAVT